MFLRAVKLIVLAVAVSSSVLVGTSSAATGHVPSRSATAVPAATVVEHVRPVTAAGRLRHGYRIANRYGGASCEFGSEATGDAYRCFTKRYVLDPCWVTARKHYVVCLPDAWSRRVARLHVTKGYDNTGFGSQPASYPWGVRESNGVRCSWLQGASGTVKGRRINYGCTKRTVLVGDVDTRSPRWRIRRARATTAGHYTMTGWVGLEKAWFGRPTLEG